MLKKFQWLTESRTQQLEADKLAKVRLELTDILIYLIRIADKLGVDLATAACDQIALKETRCPAEQVRGDAHRAGDYYT